MTDPTWLVKGAPVRAYAPQDGPDHAGELTTIKRITASLVITDDGQRWNREQLHPSHLPSFTSIRLVSARDPRVLVALAQRKIRDIEQQARNLTRLERKTPEQVAEDLLILARAAHDAYEAVREDIAAAQRAQQETNDGDPQQP
jgi:hypothetical protein